MVRTLDPEILAYIRYWTSRSKRVADKYVSKFDDESVAKKLRKLLVKEKK